MKKGPMQPLTHWFCDTCGKAISLTPSDTGWIEWLELDTGKPREFRICHNGMCARHGRKPECCDRDLSHFVGPTGKAYLLSMLYAGPTINWNGPQLERLPEMISFTDLFRRLHIPYYEEARIYFDEARSDGFFEGHNEFTVYSQPNLINIIEEYKTG